MKYTNTPALSVPSKQKAVTKPVFAIAPIVLTRLPLATG
jgi:hypothetical protein